MALYHLTAVCMSVIDVPFDANTTRNLLCVERHLPVELCLSILPNNCECNCGWNTRNTTTSILGCEFPIKRGLFFCLMDCFLLFEWLGKEACWTSFKICQIWTNFFFNHVLFVLIFLVDCSGWELSLLPYRD